MGCKPFFTTTDVWQAAFCLTYNIPLVSTDLSAEGRTVWTLDNTDDKAWQAAMDFRCGGERALVDAQAFRSAYRFLSKQSAEAHNGASHDRLNVN